VTACRPIDSCRARLAHGLVLGGAQRVGVDLAGFPARAGLDQRRRAQQAADMVGAERGCAVSGLDVVMVDIDDAAVQRGLAAVSSSLDRLVKKDKLSAEAKATAMARIHGSTDYAALKPAQLVIEAATENEGLKRRILAQLDDMLPAETLVATNTSSISITKLAAATRRPDRFIGMHFFNPVPMMALVEIIRGLQTSDATHDAVFAMAQKLGKTPITVKNAPGFVVNRILVPMINEAFFVLQEGLAAPRTSTPA
jgi:3-hydroxybutyryl-CoA dehydrogenase